MTFRELQDMALGDDFKESRRTVAAAFINEGLGKLQRAMRRTLSNLRTSVDTEAGVNVVELPTNFIELLDDQAVFYEDGSGTLEPVEVAELDGVIAQPGRPAYYALAENRLILHPTPNAVYALGLRYSGTQLLEVETDEPAIPEDQHTLLALYSRAKLYLMADDADMHLQILGSLPRELQTATVSVGRRTPKTHRVPGTWSDVGSSGPGFRHPQGLF